MQWCIWDGVQQRVLPQIKLVRFHGKSRMDNSVTPVAFVEAFSVDDESSMDVEDTLDTPSVGDTQSTGGFSC